MEILFYFVFWAVLFFVMMRFGCGAHILGHNSHGRRHADTSPGTTGDEEIYWIPPATDVDPVCGKSVSTDQAKPSIYRGHVYYFCTRECREVFEAVPQLYTTNRNQPGLEHSHV